MFDEILRDDPRTFFLYIGLVAAATLLAFAAQSKILIRTTDDGERRAYRRVRRLPFVCSFLLLSLFSCFTAVGVDRSTYMSLFEQVSLNNFYRGEQEIGFMLFALVVKIFTRDPLVFLVVFAFLTNLFVYIGIWRYRDRTSLGLAVFIFSTRYFLQSFNLMRIYFAASILIAGAYLVTDKKYVRYLFVLLAAFLFHYSVIFPIAAYIIFLVLRRIKGLAFDVKVLLCVLFLCAALLGMRAIAAILLKFVGIPMIARYAKYLQSISISGLGFGWIFHMIPYAVCLYLISLFRGNNEIKELTLAYFTIYLMLSILAYFIPVIGRGRIVMNMPLVLFLPQAVERCGREWKLRRRQDRTAGVQGSVTACRCTTACLHNSYVILYVVMAAYLLIAFALYLSEYFYLDGISHFTFMWS